MTAPSAPTCLTADSSATDAIPPAAITGRPDPIARVERTEVWPRERAHPTDGRHEEADRARSHDRVECFGERQVGRRSAASADPIAVDLEGDHELRAEVRYDLGRAVHVGERRRPHHDPLGAGLEGSSHVRRIHDRAGGLHGHSESGDRPQHPETGLLTAERQVHVDDVQPGGAGRHQRSGRMKRVAVVGRQGLGPRPSEPRETTA